MQNYEAVRVWVAGLNVDKASAQIDALKIKYPWLKCEEVQAALNKLKNDLPKMATIVMHQEKQNAIHRMKVEQLQEYIRVNGLADTAIAESIVKKYNIDL